VNGKILDFIGTSARNCLKGWPIITKAIDWIIISTKTAENQGFAAFL
jgi:hypothetical protein